MKARIQTRSRIERKVSNGKRLVYGEVMPAAPDFQDGGTYRQSELDGVHYDGLFMPEAEVATLAHRLARNAVLVDVNHDHRRREADVVETFIAGEGWDPWEAGASVAGVQIHDDEVWGRVEDLSLGAYSIDIWAVHTTVRIIVVDDNGENPKPLELTRLSDPEPVWLSLVGPPATGRGWKRIQRMALPYEDLPLAPDTADWNEALALARVRSHCSDGADRVNLAEWRRAFAYVADDDQSALGTYALPIADATKAGLVAVPRAIYAAAAKLNEGRSTVPEEAVPSVREHLSAYYARLGKTPPWEAESEPVEASFDGVPDGVGPSHRNAANPAEERSVPDDKTTDIPTEHTLSDEEKGIFRRFLRSIGLGSDANATEDGTPPESVERDATTEPAAEGETAEDMATIARAFAERHELTATFGEMVTGREIYNAIHFGSDLLEESMWMAVYAIGDGRQAPAEVIADVERSCTEFGAYMAEAFRKFAAGGAESAMRAAVVEAGEIAKVERAGKKMAAKRLEAFASALKKHGECGAELKALYDDLTDGDSPDEDEPGEAMESAEASAADIPVDDQAEQDDAEDTERSARAELRAEFQAQFEAMRAELTASAEALKAERDAALAKAATAEAEAEAVKRAPLPPKGSAEETPSPAPRTAPLPTAREMRHALFAGPASPPSDSQE